MGGGRTWRFDCRRECNGLECNGLDNLHLYTVFPSVVNIMATHLSF